DSPSKPPGGSVPKTHGAGGRPRPPCFSLLFECEWRLMGCWLTLHRKVQIVAARRVTLRDQVELIAAGIQKHEHASWVATAWTLQHARWTDADGRHRYRCASYICAVHVAK